MAVRLFAEVCVFFFCASFIGQFHFIFQDDAITLKLIYHWDKHRDKKCEGHISSRIYYYLLLLHDLLTSLN